MLSKIKNILTYYDSEPSEIMHGIIWLIIFPIVYSIEHGVNIFLLLLSISIGFSSIYSACYLSLKIRKAAARSVFLLSVVVATMYGIKGDYICPTHWGWGLISFSAFFNLKRICNHYYISENG